MGLYVNPGDRAFREAVNSTIYVDKSGLIPYTDSVLNTKQKYVCVSRPRRFGKTMAADMLAAYYSRGCDSKKVFAGLLAWTGTETYEALKVYIERNFDGLREAVAGMLGNARCRIDPTTFQNDMTTFHTKDDVLTLLVHLGYLTYDEDTSEVFIPNKEVEQEFMRAVKVGGWGRLMETLNRSEELLKST